MAKPQSTQDHLISLLGELGLEINKPQVNKVLNEYVKTIEEKMKAVRDIEEKMGTLSTTKSSFTERTSQIALARLEEQKAAAEAFYGAKEESIKASFKKTTPKELSAGLQVRQDALKALDKEIEEVSKLTLRRPAWANKRLEILRPLKENLESQINQ